MFSTPSLLEARAARIAVDDVVVAPGLDFVARGGRVVLGGDAGVLVAAIHGVPLGGVDDDRPPGEVRVVGGALRVLGLDVAAGGHVPSMGAAPLDPPLPPEWTAAQYVEWGARLGGADGGLARALAPLALVRVGLGEVRARPLRTLALVERRVLVLAQAIVLSPAVLVAEAPLAGLEGSSAELAGRALGAAMEGRAAIVSTRRLELGAPEGALARAASDVLVLANGELVLEGSPDRVLSGGRVFALTVRANTEPLRAELAARGIDLRGGPLRCSLALPPHCTTADVLAASARARAPIVELVPLFG
jgi:ABC-2 type transport system ATP-binding protein